MGGGGGVEGEPTTKQTKEKQTKQQQPNSRLTILNSCVLFTLYKEENDEGGGG